MLVRIVKMSFSPSKIDEFLNNFEANKKAIRNFKGCELLELYNELNNPEVYFTYSYWQSEMHLEQYRFMDYGFKFKVWPNGYRNWYLVFGIWYLVFNN